MDILPPRKPSQTKPETAQPPTETHHEPPAHHRSRRDRLVGWLQHHPVLVGGAAGLIALVILGAGLWFWKLRPRDNVTRQETAAVTKEAEPPKPATLASPLTGVQVEPELAQRQVTAVVIENHADARPQSSLGEAGVVYEALAEGGITRFLAFYQEAKPGSIGPIRSLRPYFIDWALEFGAPIAHAGGSAEALALVGPTGAKSLNLLSYSGNAIRTRDRYAPHNLYSTTDLLDQLKVRLGYVATPTFTPTPRKADTPAAPPTRPTIRLNYSYGGFQVEYRYDATSNSYARFIAGQPHIERNNGQQIMVKNVVVEMMPVSYATTGHAVMPTVGRGQAFVFRDGTVVEGTWVKTSRSERTKLVDAAGVEIPLNVGNTWYSIVPVGRPPG